MAAGTLGADGVLRYELEQRTADVEILPGLRTRALTYAGSVPGPTLVSRSGRRTEVTVRNGLTVPTVTHLHGGHTPADSDGYPTDLVAAGTTSRVHAYPMEQRAATLWYHDHTMAATAQNVWRGLFGLHLVHDDEEDALGLPSGDRDLPVTICDRSFAADGSLLYPPVTPGHGGMAMVPPEYQDGVLGDVTLVNGVPWPVLEAPAVRHRLRLLNAANARAYRLALFPPPPGGKGWCRSAATAACSRRRSPTTRSTCPPASATTSSSTSAATSRVPSSTSSTSWSRGCGRSCGSGSVSGCATTPASPTGCRRWSASTPGRPWSGAASTSGPAASAGRGPSTPATFDPGRVDAAPTLGAVEVWSFTSDVAHPVHVHLDPFQVVSRGQPGRRSPQDVGWKDTVAVRPSETVEVAVRFTDYAGRYVMHCHNLEHEDMAMMANVVTR